MAVRTRNVVSLCAGCGGLELGIGLALRLLGERARGICYVEREAAAAASLVASMAAGWFHPAPVWSDLRTFDARPWRGLVHILASGDPCQDNSVAGKRAGADGQRFLAPEVVRIADECGADLIFRENVPGNADGQLEAIVPALERLGCCVAAGIFSSAETGNTMRRERLFIMARRQSGGLGSLRQEGGEGVSRHADGGRPGMEGAGGGRHGHEDREIRARRHGAVDAGEHLARAAVQRPGEAGADFGRSAERDSGPGGTLDGPERPERGPIDGPCREGGRDDVSRREEGADGLGSSGAELAGAGREGSQGQQRGQHHAAGRQVEGRHAGLRSGTILPPAVIPGPTDSRWIDVLDRWPEYQPALSQEEAESHLRRGIDAMANRVESLRATGNGVDPVAAAYAFLSLGALLAAGAATSDFVLN